PHELSGAYGPFTVKGGPDENALKPVPGGIRFLTQDPVAKKYYGIDAHCVYEVDLEKNTKTKMEPPAELPRLSWTCGISFDTKRQRLLVTTLGGVGYLYSYTPKTGKWEVICDMDNQDLASMVYDPKTDRTYGFPMAFGGARNLKLSIRNAAGAIVSTIDL